MFAALGRRKRLEVPLDMLLGFGPYVFLLAAIAAVYTFVSPQSGGNQDSFGLRVARPALFANPEA